MDFRLAPIALATWLSAALTIGLIGSGNPIWFWVTATLCLLMGQLAFRRLAGSEIDIRTLGKMVLLGAILGCTISLIRIYQLVSGPIANAS